MPSLPIRKIGRSTWGRPLYRVEEMIFYQYKHRDLRLNIYVPPGYVTDLASIPWPLCYLLCPDGPWAHAAIFHDYLIDQGVNRFLCDAIFRHVLWEDRTHVSLPFYYGVRMYWACIGKWLALLHRPKIPKN